MTRNDGMGWNLTEIAGVAPLVITYSAAVPLGGEGDDLYVRGHLMQMQGRLRCPNTTTYTFYLSATDGARVSIDQEDVLTVFMEEEQQVKLYLSAGLHEINVEYLSDPHQSSIRVCVSVVLPVEVGRG